MLLSDSGGIFRAKQAQAIYVALDIEKREIHTHLRRFPTFSRE